ncbi:MAG: NAD-dependent epimerase/dehydratase family protein [Candidatus Solibacter sp.]
MAEILVTGGAGCIGSDLAEVLLSRGDRVRVIDNLSSGKVEHIEALLPNPNFRFIEADLLHREQWDDALDGVDMVYHLAANPDVKFTLGDATDKDLQQNLIVTYNLLESAREHGIRRFAFASTSAIYGISPVQPIPENVSPRPISLYGATKLGCEAMISAFSQLFGMQCWVLRFANIVGPKVRKRGRTVISDFLHNLAANPGRLQILGNGHQAKSYLLSNECVEAILYVVEHAHDPFNVFNLGGDDSLSVRRIADIVIGAMGLEDVELAFTGGEGGWPGDVPRFTLDVAAINALGWRARHTSEEAVTTAVHQTMHAAGISRAGELPACRQ